ncbi:hypothetical protein DSM112329_01774 [Paraconexibacter sp. AEG42_29]|uniref:Uncharacterized protein n=1 Tax=Paraconexibacter sp. AEG42_29 TaxID=2997339 RepID=A0AAU7ATB4_9ACTN
MSSPAPTQQQPPAAPPAPAPASAVDLPTLIITAIASALAAYICSKVWEPGTLASAATTPVLVAIGKELLRKPTEVVTTAVPPVLPGRHPRPRPASGPDEPTTVEPAPGADIGEPAIVAVTAPVVTTPEPGGRRLHWRVAVITGLLGFVLAAAVITLPQLIKGGGTTYFGGGTTHVKKRVVTTTTDTTTVVEPGKTVTTTTTPTTTTTTTTPPAVTTTTETSPPTVTETVTTPTTTTTPPPDEPGTTTSETDPTSPIP